MRSEKNRGAPESAGASDFESTAPLAMGYGVKSTHRTEVERVYSGRKNKAVAAASDRDEHYTIV